MSAPYYPYRPYKVIVLLLAVFVLAYICLAILCLFQYVFELLLLSIVGLIILILFLKTIISSLKTGITCDSDCIHIDEKNVRRSISWNSLTNKYRSRSIKGHEYLIFSHCELQKDDIKKAISQSSFKFQVCFDNYYVIFLDWRQPQLVQELERYIDAYMSQNINEE